MTYRFFMAKLWQEIDKDDKASLKGVDLDEELYRVKVELWQRCTDLVEEAVDKQVSLLSFWRRKVRQCRDRKSTSDVGIVVAIP